MTRSHRSSSKCSPSEINASSRAIPRRSVDVGVEARFRFIAVLLLLLMGAGCQTAPQKPTEDITPGSRQGAWEAKALIEDKRSGKSNTVSLDFLARRPSQMRMEVTTQIGLHIASFALSGERVSYSLTRQKKHVLAPAKPEVMRDLIALALDPRAIVDLLFDRRLGQDWNCQFDGAGLPSMCESSEGEVTITWAERAQHKRVVRIEAPHAKVTMSLHETQPKVQIEEKLFTIAPPAGFRSNRIE